MPNKYVIQHKSISNNQWSDVYNVPIISKHCHAYSWALHLLVGYNPNEWRLVAYNNDKLIKVYKNCGRNINNQLTKLANESK